MEYILSKKFSRHEPSSSVPEERVVAIRLKADRSVRAGQPWTHEVADFYMEIYPQMFEYGLSLYHPSTLNLGAFWE